MKIAVAQIECTPGDVTANCAKIVSFAKQARDRKCDLVVFPELTDTGYDVRSVKRQASSWAGLPLALVKKTAAGLGIHVICGLSERDSGTVFNSLAVVDPQGELRGKYRKVHLFRSGTADERRCFSAGGSLEIVHLGILRVGLLICYDLRFPEMSRTMSLQGVDALVVSAAWPAARAQHWVTLLAARAIENQCYVIGCNRVGTDAKLTFAGQSCIIEPSGEVIAQGSPDKEELLVGEINRTAIAKVRATIQVFKDRRSELYQQ
jgi:omega-amidase